MYKVTKKDIEKLKAKDEKTFDMIWATYANALVHFVVNNFNLNEFDAEDIAEQALIYATYTKIDQFDDSISQFSTWLFTIAKNYALDYIRKTNKNYNTLSNDTFISKDKTNDIKIIHDLKSLLSDLDFDVIINHVIYGYSIKEIAKMKSKKISYVKFTLNRAYKKAKKYLMEESSHEEKRN